MAKKKQSPKELVKPIDPKIIEAPNGIERFTCVYVEDVTKVYPLLSVHELPGGFSYQVVSILNHPDGLAIEFVRV